MPGRPGCASRQWNDLQAVDDGLPRRGRLRTGARSGADVGREVLAGEGEAVGDVSVGRACEDDATAVVAGAGAEVDDPVGAP
jgi:hypothetical protein